MNILLIEPDVVLARVYQRALATDGHTVAVEGSAQAAIHAADEQRPDVVLLELQLVGHSGIEFLYEFRSYEDWQPIPVIVLSQVPQGEFMDSWRLLQHELGVAKYVYKPRTSLEKLLHTVNEFVPAVS